MPLTLCVTRYRLQLRLAFSLDNSCIKNALCQRCDDLKENKSQKRDGLSSFSSSSVSSRLTHHHTPASVTPVFPHQSVQSVASDKQARRRLRWQHTTSTSTIAGWGATRWQVGTPGHHGASGAMAVVPPPSQPAATPRPAIGWHGAATARRRGMAGTR